LLLARPASAAPVQVESPDGRPSVEATPESWARRAQACREDLKLYQIYPTPELVDRLLPCLNHPDTRLRALILDKFVDARIFNAPNFKKDVYPKLRKAAADFQDNRLSDPTGRVRQFAFDIDWWLDNWANHLNPDVVAAKRREEEEHERFMKRDDDKIPYAIAVMVLSSLVVLVSRLWGRFGGKRRRRG